MTIENAKQEYNKLLKRFYDAEKYFGRKDIVQVEKEKFLGSFQEILAALNYYLSLIEVYTNQEVLEGFKG